MSEGGETETSVGHIGSSAVVYLIEQLIKQLIKQLIEQLFTAGPAEMF